MYNNKLIYIMISDVYVKKERVEKQIKINHLGMTVVLGFEVSALGKRKSLVQFPDKLEHIFSFCQQMHSDNGEI